MPNTIPPIRLLLGIATGAALMMVCLAYHNENHEPNYAPHHMATPTYHPDVDYLMKDTYHNVCYSGDTYNINTCQRDDRMRTPYETEEEHHIMWMFLPLLSCAYYVYRYIICKGDDENDTKEKIKTVQDDSRGSVDDVQVSSSSASNNKCLTRETARQHGLVLYDGNWYSVATFVPYHPGGEEVLSQYLGSDISFVFRVMHRHPNKIMEHRKPVRAASEEEMKALSTRREEICNEMMEDYQLNGTSRVDPSSSKDSTQKFSLEAFEKDVNELYNQFLHAGYFKPTLFWLIHKTALVMLFLSLSILSMKTLDETSAISYIIPGIFLGLFWHQSGFLMHDAEHHNLVGNERINDILGWMYGTVFLGVNGAWWREEHREHHALLNTFDDEGFKDPQVRHSCICYSKVFVV